METRKRKVWEGVLGAEYNGFFEEVGPFHFSGIMWLEPDMAGVNAGLGFL